MNTAITATTKRKSDNTVYRITEVFSKDKNMGDIMKRLALKKARNFESTEK